MEDLNTISSSAVNLLNDKQGFALKTTSFNFDVPAKEPVVQNVVATANLQCALDLKQVAIKARNSEYNPKRFCALIMRIREPKTTALIFSSGKIVVTGARDEAQARLASRKFTRIIQKIGYSATFTEFKIQNLVASADIRFPVRLEGIAIKHFNFSSYEPEVFPGLIYRMLQPKLSLLLFTSGKMVFTGAKTREDIKVAFKKIYPVLKEFKKEKNGYLI